ncbi:MAG: hypothetical protein C5B51_27485 [Terriglobia bacterium]|nr:MAG: hypothetical protein C5B51_27485 [Terriglobia bacterium]
MTTLVRQLTRIPGLRHLWRKFPVGSAHLRVEFDIWDYPAYAYGVYSAANLARLLGHDGISVIEFGVAGGSGLVALEQISEHLSMELGVRISAFGFDTGQGMPEPTDYRDLPYVWGPGFYRMDPDALRHRLHNAQLLLGNVGDTVKQFCATVKDPIGFVSFDLDYHSSTKSALSIFQAHACTRLPRVFCYFDDVIWPERACYSEYAGEYLAIREFNAQYEAMKLSKIPHLSWMRQHAAAWNEQMYVLHDFFHPEYCTNITPVSGRQM